MQEIVSTTKLGTSNSVKSNIEGPTTWQFEPNLKVGDTDATEDERLLHFHPLRSGSASGIAASPRPAQWHSTLLLDSAPIRYLFSSTVIWLLVFDAWKMNTFVPFVTASVFGPTSPVPSGLTVRLKEKG